MNTDNMTDGNPCFGCKIQQKCCKKLQGLTLSPAEYERLFAVHADKFTIKRRGELYELWSTQPCPHLQEGGHCGIHSTRGMDCRLYPFSIYWIQPEDQVIVYNTWNRCPHKPRFFKFMSDKDALELLDSFARDIWGKDAQPAIVRETQGAWVKWALGKMGFKVNWR